MQEGNFDIKTKYLDCKTELIWGKHRDSIPYFTIMIPTYKRRNLLEQAVNSAINQRNFDDYEIVICDNDSLHNNETERFIRELNNNKVVYYKNEKNIGMAGNIWKIVLNARGKWVVLLDDDDLLAPNYLATVYNYINKNNICGMIGTNNFTIKGEDIFHFPDLCNKSLIYKVSKTDFFLGNCLSSPGQAMPKRIYIELLNSQKDENLMGDQIVQYIFLKKYGLHKIEEPLTAYRICNNISQNDDALKSMFLGMAQFWRNIGKDSMYIYLITKFFYNEYVYIYVRNGIYGWKSSLDA